LRRSYPGKKNYTTDADNTFQHFHNQGCFMVGLSFKYSNKILL
jgi:hypothetical protein